MPGNFCATIVTIGFDIQLVPISISSRYAMSNENKHAINNYSFHYFCENSGKRLFMIDYLHNTIFIAVGKRNVLTF